MPLSITIEKRELYDEKENRFIEIPTRTIILEHSLLSISKWESKWHKPFFTNNQKSKEEMIDYVRCMTISGVCDPEHYYGLSNRNWKEIHDYIQNPMTATTVKNPMNRSSNEVLTNELIYYWMTELNIPFSCDKWHINRLLTLIEVASVKKKPPKKMSQSAVMRQNHALNAARRAKYGTRG